MKIEPVDIKVDKEKEKPPECIRPRPVPAHWRKENEKILDELEEAGLIEKLDVSEGYLSPSFCILKPSDILTPHLVIDHSKINDNIVRPGQVTPSCIEVIQKMREGNKYFFKFGLLQWILANSHKSRDKGSDCLHHRVRQVHLECVATRFEVLFRSFSLD